MKLGLAAVNGGPYATREALARVAELAEASGLESVWAPEHVVLVDPQAPPSPLPPYHPLLDPIAALAFLAARTTTVRLGTGVIVLPFRNPLVVAKQLASLDVLSGGRLIFGIGVGYVEKEFEALGVPFAQRGARTDECLAAIRAIWTEDEPSLDGTFVSFAGVQSRPQPVQRPYPPVVVGGASPAAFRRAVEQANGWYGWSLGLDEAASAIAAIRQAADRYRRPASLGELEITVTPNVMVDAEGAKAYAALGVHRLNLPLPATPSEQALADFSSRVAAIGGSG